MLIDMSQCKAHHLSNQANHVSTNMTSFATTVIKMSIVIINFYQSMFAKARQFHKMILLYIVLGLHLMVNLQSHKIAIDHTSIIIGVQQASV